MAPDYIPWQLATLFEAVADRIPDHLVLVQGQVRRTYREFEQRASQLAAALADMGLEPDGKVAIYMTNCPEYKEAEFATAKQRGVSVSVNFRYLDDELVYLLDNADAEILIYHRRFAERVWAVRERLPQMRHLIEVDDGAPCESVPKAKDYEFLIGSHAPAPRIPRQEDDMVLVYTGGTTGVPKGVIFTQAASLRFTTVGYEFYGLPQPGNAGALVEAASNLARQGHAPVSLVCAPFMHSVGSTLGHTMTVFMGGTVIMLEGASFDPAEAWRLVERESVTQIVLVGDAIGRPLLDELDRASADGCPYDISSMQLMASSGVMWSREVKRGLLRHHDMRLIDFFGSSEGGMGMSVATRAELPDTAVFVARRNVRLLDDDDAEIPWGSGKPGRIAATGDIPHGYYKDAEKTAATFKSLNGVLYSIPGDYAKIDAEGRITMLGRGTACINTGGEKVFAEEVEEAIKRHPAVYDCLVVGIPDPRFGARVAAVVAPLPDTMINEAELQDSVAEQLADFKVPRTITIVDTIPRAANGKADYRWALERAAAHAGVAVSE